MWRIYGLICDKSTDREDSSETLDSPAGSAKANWTCNQQDGIYKPITNTKVIGY